MTSWVLIAVLAFLVFGIPLIDDVYRYRARRRLRPETKATEGFDLFD
jgi:hypothetical protein